MDARERLIVALDVDNLTTALSLVDKLTPHVGYFKVGLELLTAVGAPQVVTEIHKRHGKIFFDGKFDDIPNTVAGATKSVAGLGVALFDVHASAGLEAMKAAVKNKGKARCLAVTVLTSFTEEECQATFGASPDKKVLEFALKAAEAGVDGIVCSPRELATLGKSDKLKALWKVTPGVRPSWASGDDQKRIMTPLEAIRQGATHLVVGRPILRPPPAVGDPVTAAKKIVEEIAEALR